MLRHSTSTTQSIIQEQDEASIFGGVLNSAAGLSNLIGGNCRGSGEAADILRGVGDVANFFGFGVKNAITKN